MDHFSWWFQMDYCMNNSLTKEFHKATKILMGELMLMYFFFLPIFRDLVLFIYFFALWKGKIGPNELKPNKIEKYNPFFKGCWRMFNSLLNVLVLYGFGSQLKGKKLFSFVTTSKVDNRESNLLAFSFNSIALAQWG